MTTTSRCRTFRDFGISTLIIKQGMDELFHHIANLHSNDSQISLVELVKSLSPDINNDNILSQSEWARGKLAAARYISLILRIEDQTGASIIKDDAAIDIHEFKKCAQRSIQGFADDRFVTGVNVNQQGQYVPGDVHVVGQHGGHNVNAAGETVPENVQVVKTGPKYVNGEIEMTAAGKNVFGRAQAMLRNVHQ